MGVKRGAFLVFVAFSVGIANLSAQPKPFSPPPTTKAKADCLVSFAKYVEWPTGDVLDATNPIIIGVLGRNPVADVLEKTVASQSVGKRKVTVRQANEVRELRDCQIIYISGVERANLPAVLSELSDCPALTVGELPQFLERGMIIFVSVRDSVRFDVNLANVEPAGLKISARMLAAARKVYPAPGTPKRR
jgi:YfiR/HmsC-like